MSKPHHDAEEIRCLLDVRQAESLTYKELSERSGVPVHVLTYRASQARQRTGEQSGHLGADGFVEVVASSESSCASPERPGGVELLLPGNVRCFVGPDFDEATLALLLRVARC